MGMKKIRVELTDASGQPAAGVNVKATDCGELQTGPDGRAFFLVDADTVAITVGGAEVYSGALDSTPEMLKFKQSGSGWTAA